jgi:hypothetical protein
MISVRDLGMMTLAFLSNPPLTMETQRPSLQRQIRSRKLAF